MRYLSLLFTLLFFSCEFGNKKKPESASFEERPETLPEITYRKSKVDFSLMVRDSLEYRLLTFSKNPDSTTFRHMKYDCNCGRGSVMKNEIENIELLWNIAADSIEIQLHSVDVGYPLVYQDILQKQIKAFTQDQRWLNHVERNGKKLNYKLIKQVMADQGIYKTLDPLLNKKGYRFSHFSTEKHGFVTEDILQQTGYSGEEVVPMPYMVFIILKPN